MCRHAGHHAAHPVLADAVVDEVATVIDAGLCHRAIPGHPGVAGQVGTARHEPGDLRSDGVDTGLDGLAGSHGPVLRGEGGQSRRPTGQSVPSHTRLVASAVAVPGSKPLGPFPPPGLAPRDAGPVHRQHLVGDPELLVRGQAEDLLGQADLLFGEGITVGLGRVGEVGGRIADVAPEDDERRAVLVVSGSQEGGFECVEVVGHLADVLDSPAIGGEPLAHVVGVGQLGGPVDGDVVVVVHVDQASELEVSGQ